MRSLKGDKTYASQTQTHQQKNFEKAKMKLKTQPTFVVQKIP